LESDYQRAQKSHKVHSGTARRRGRTARIGKSALIVVGENAKLASLSGSIAGVEVKSANEISVLDLAPGSKPIRLTLYSESAMNQLGKMGTRANRIMEISTKGISR